MVLGHFGQETRIITQIHVQTKSAKSNLRKGIVVEYLNVRISGPISHPKPLHQANVIK